MPGPPICSTPSLSAHISSKASQRPFFGLSVSDWHVGRVRVLESLIWPSQRLSEGIVAWLVGLCFWDSGRFAEILRFRGKIAYAGS